MTQRERAEVLWRSLNATDVKGNKTREIEEIITALIDSAAQAAEQVVCYQSCCYKPWY